MKKRANGEGSLSKRDNGSWRAQVIIDGKRTGKTFKLRKEAQDWIKANRQRTRAEQIAFELEENRRIEELWRQRAIQSELAKEQKKYEREMEKRKLEIEWNNKEPNYQPSRSGYVYLVEQGEFIKIGFATNPFKRMRALQTANPNGISFLFCIQADMALEKQLHQKYDRFRIRSNGEWFNNKQVVVDDIKNNYSVITIDEIAAHKEADADNR